MFSICHKWARHNRLFHNFAKVTSIVNYWEDYFISFNRFTIFHINFQMAFLYVCMCVCVCMISMYTCMYVCRYVRTFICMYVRFDINKMCFNWNSV